MTAGLPSAWSATGSPPVKQGKVSRGIGSPAGWAGAATVSGQDGNGDAGEGCGAGEGSGAPPPQPAATATNTTSGASRRSAHISRPQPVPRVLSRVALLPGMPPPL